MGNIYSYYAAADDAEALEHFEGDCMPDPHGLTGLKGADPYFMLATVEAVLTGVTEDEVHADPRFCGIVSDPEDEGHWLVSLRDTLRDGLAAATTVELREVADVWRRAEEGADWSLENAVDFLERLAALARDADGRGHLYCAMSL